MEPKKSETFPKFSIIIPVYNVEDYLLDCMQSLLIQTFRNYEIILVDDGATDSSGKKCDEFAQADNRVSVIHKINGGLSSARNAGLDKAKGDYIIFVDSDDFVYGDDSLEQINKKLELTKAEVLLYTMRRYYTETDTFADIITIPVNSQLIDESDLYDVVSYLIENNLFRASACNKVVSRKLIENYKMRFMEGYLSEDLDWCGKLLLYANKYAYLDQPIYSYRQQREGSITSNRKTDKLVRDKLYMCKIGYQEAINQTDKKKKWLLASYYAYEYAVLIGISRGASKELVNQMKQLAEILNFDLCNKVKLVKRVCHFIGFRLTRLILCSFVERKNRRNV